jgi:two-component system CheB/CheR fusion protein
MIDAADGQGAPTSDGGAKAAPFPIVGIGASAGGLAPVVRILGQLGEPRLAVVIVAHLDPTHESSLVEIYARATAMPVAAARDGMRVEPRHVYVVPPSTQLTLAGGTLRLASRQDDGPHMPIDRFFASLAEDCGARAVGVVVSGTGSDGSRGIQAIKAEGGLTLAQDETAGHGGMPTSAFATGSVDLILSPDQNAVELARIAASPPPDVGASASPSDESELQRILVVVRHATGIDFAQYKQRTLLRRMARRSFLRRLGSLREYADLVESDPAEAKTLSEEALIHVTSFFREPAAFDALKTEIFPRLLERRRHETPNRIWVPGCSTAGSSSACAPT